MMTQFIDAYMCHQSKETHYVKSPGKHFKNAYEFLNQGALKILTLHKNIFQWMG